MTATATKDSNNNDDDDKRTNDEHNKDDYDDDATTRRHEEEEDGVCRRRSLVRPCVCARALVASVVSKMKSDSKPLLTAQAEKANHYT